MKKEEGSLTVNPKSVFPDITQSREILHHNPPPPPPALNALSHFFHPESLLKSICSPFSLGATEVSFHHFRLEYIDSQFPTRRWWKLSTALAELNRAAPICTSKRFGLAELKTKTSLSAFQSISLALRDCSS